MTAPAPIRIRAANLELVRTAAQLTSDAALARAMRVSPSTVARTLSGKSHPGAAFIAAMLGAFPGIPFEALFESAEVSE